METTYTADHKVLDHGFVRYLEHMGTDKSIVADARLSYRSKGRDEAADRKLIRYLFRHRHCYHPEMEVLTAEGWKKWRNLGKTAKFLVPHVDSFTYRIEELPVLRFETQEDMYTYSNDRMSYSVTEGHRMYFKPKYQSNFDIFKVEDMPRWGHFCPLRGITLGDAESTSAELAFVGFYLGDGSYGSTNRAVFHFKKQRKKDYLERLCDELGITYSVTQSATHEEGTVYYVQGCDILRRWIDPEQRAAEKFFPMDTVAALTPEQRMGLLDGLVNSDGHINESRPQITFSSASACLVELYEFLCACAGVPAHQTGELDGDMSTVLASFGDRTSLEARKQYHSRTPYSGDVYCATTSTGLLAVRGCRNEYGFLCGNTSPFEMGKIKFNIKLPIFVMRQLVRHRMQNLNEVSARYTALPDEFFVPDMWRVQDTKNKQSSLATELWGPEGPTLSIGDGNPWKANSNVTATEALMLHCKQSYELYQKLIASGVARELARVVLPMNIYTEIVSCMDVHNLINFLVKRRAPGAQKEIQVYADAMFAIAKDLFPWTMEEYIRCEKSMRRVWGDDETYGVY